MLGRLHRFHGHNSLRVVYSRGKTVRSQQLAIKTIASKPGRPFRVAVVVSKKVSKSAVVRNRIRRRLYELVRQHTQSRNIDMVVTVFSEQLADIPARELEALVTDLLRQVSDELQKADHSQ